MTRPPHSDAISAEGGNAVSTASALVTFHDSASRPRPPRSEDRTESQVRRQLVGFGCQHFELGLIPPKDGQDLPREPIRTWPTETILKNLAFLKARTASGYDVFIRPAAGNGDGVLPLIFIDDLAREACGAVEAAGFAFAVLIESSPGNFHGWVRLGQAPISRKLATAAAKDLAERFGADPASADWRHFGRLAGFTNRKSSRRLPDGRHPFVRLQSTSADVSCAAREMLERLETVESERETSSSRLNRKSTSFAVAPRRTMHVSADEHFAHARVRLEHRRRDGTPDDSVSDFRACMSLIRAGYEREDVALALRTSPGLATRHADPEDYVERTVANALRFSGSSSGSKERRDQSSQSHRRGGARSGNSGPRG